MTTYYKGGSFALIQAYLENHTIYWINKGEEKIPVYKEPSDVWRLANTGYTFKVVEKV
jgi:hypothetical protein